MWLGCYTQEENEPEREFADEQDDSDSNSLGVYDLWLACWTDKAIGEEVNLTEEAVRQITQETATLPKLGKSDKAAAEHATDFEVPLYNIWKQQEKTVGSSHHPATPNSPS